MNKTIQQIRLICDTCKQEYSKEGHIFKCDLCWGIICDVCHNKPIHKEDCQTSVPHTWYGYPE